MASGDKADLARAGTMEVTTKEGRAFLEKNLTEWKKPLLLDQQVDDKESTSSTGSGKKGRGGKKPAQKESEDDEEEQPTAKKARMAKATTMLATAKEGKDLIGGEKLGDTRQVTKAKQRAAKGSAKRVSTMAKVVEEAKEVFGNLGSADEGRALRKRPASAPAPPKIKPAKKAAMKKAGTMVKTAKEGAALIGDEDLGDTRQVTKQKQKKAAAAAKSGKKTTKKCK